MVDKNKYYSIICFLPPCWPIRHLQILPLALPPSTSFLDLKLFYLLSVKSHPYMQPYNFCYTPLLQNKNSSPWNMVIKIVVTLQHDEVATKFSKANYNRHVHHLSFPKGDLVLIYDQVHDKEVIFFRYLSALLST